MPWRILLLLNAHEPGGLNLARAFAEAGHRVGLAHHGGPRGEGESFLQEFSGAREVYDLYPRRPREERRIFLLDGAAHHLDGVPGARAAGALLPPLLDLAAARRAGDALRPVLRDFAPDVVLGFWGIGPLAEFRALQRMPHDAALVHQFQTYPLTRVRVGQRQASALHRAVFGRLDGRMHASPQMEQFVHDALRPRRGVDKVLPEAWGSWACAKERKPRLSLSDAERHVVHVGTAPRAPGSFDDVGAQLQAIAAEGVHVHAVEGFALRGPRAHTFPRLGWQALLEGGLATFLTQFDALVLLYNAPPGLQWFAGNMPARFLSALSAGVPVAVPRGLFGAVQDFVERRGNGFVFDTPRDLAAKLRDDALMARCRGAALDVLRTHRLDLLLPKHEHFLEQVLDVRAGKLRSEGLK